MTAPNVPKIKVCEIVNSFDAGGLERVVINLLNNLDRNRFELSFICLDSAGSLFDQINLDGIRYAVFHRQPGIDWKLLFQVRRFFCDNSIDIIHAHNHSPLVYAGLAAKLMRRRPRMIYTEHNLIYKISARARKKFTWYVKAADLILTVSADLQRYFSGPLGIRQQILVMPNGIDGSRFPPVPRPREASNESGPTLGTAVVISRQKGLHVMLKAFALLAEEFPQLRLVIAGDGEQKAQMQALAKELDIAARVQFLGFQSDIPQVLSIYDIFLLSSLWEGHPLCLLEAMAAGLPIVCTDVGGCREIVADGENGFVVPKEDPQVFAAATRRLIVDPTLRQQMATANREKFQQYFSLQTMVARHQDLFAHFAGHSPTY